MILRLALLLGAAAGLFASGCATQRGGDQRTRPGARCSPPLCRESRARCVSPSRRDAAVLRPAPRHDRRRGVAGRRLVHGNPRPVAEGTRSAVRRAPRSRVQRIRPPDGRRLPREARGAPRPLRQSRRHHARRPARETRNRAAGIGRPGRDLPQPAQLDDVRLAARGLRSDARGAQARRRARRRRASRRSAARRRIRRPLRATCTSNTRSS